MTLEELTAKVEEMQGQITERDTKIAALEKSVADKQSENDALKTALESFGAQTKEEAEKKKAEEAAKAKKAEEEWLKAEIKKL